LRDYELRNLFERLAIDAGRAVMEVYRSDFSVETKGDSSPVTLADKAAEAIILAGLRSTCPLFACVAEEEVGAGVIPAALGDAFILVDPLDGTREFIERQDGFTVNIALIRGDEPVVGVVYAPASGRLFSGEPAHAEAAEVSADGRITNRRAIRVRPMPSQPIIVASRSHRTPETDAFIARFAGAELVSIGSSLKFCLVAAGEADLYPRFGRTMEWDTAAGDAVLRAAGGRTETVDGEPLRYGKRDVRRDTDFANPDFVARGS
jgi:3'(2'), 5'-bisphosphate nucleotidase